MRDTPAANVTQQALAYFQSPQPGFWRWVENGEIIEWNNGATICYREELVRLLTDLAPNGLPPLSTLLLVLAACNDGWAESDDATRELYNLLYTSPVDNAGNKHEQTQKLKEVVDHTTSFLKIVAALPPELRKGLGKRQLLHELFAQEYRYLPADRARAVVEEWASGRLDTQLLTGSATTSQRFEVGLFLLSRAYTRFPTTESLDFKLFTGLNQAPEPVELPPLPPTPEPADLLSELAADPKTAGLAQLTQRLVASIRIPLHAQGSSDQPFGGVSDVSNHGSFDRLLLSELAQDDLTLTARLVNNEALYLRREEPPHQEQRQRILLLDTTLRMWGVPRVFALAAALACAMPRRQPVAVSAYALSGLQALPLDLATKEGVTQALGYLDPSLHCGPALQDFVRALPTTSLTECLLFTTAEQVQQPEFALLLSELKPALRFLLTVERSGALHLHEFTKAGRVLLSTTHYNLDELLFAPAPARLPVQPSDNKPLAFFAHKPAPLFFPIFDFRPSVHNTFRLPDLGVVAAVSLQRVLYWPHRTEGARELLPFIEFGKVVFGFNGDMVYLLVSNLEQKTLHYYQVLPETETPLSIDLSMEIKDVQSTLEVYFTWPNFLVRVDYNIRLIDCRTGTVVKRTYFDHSQKPDTSTRFDSQQIKQHINNGYNVLLKVSRIAINEEGLLTVGGHVLRFTGDQLKFTNKAKDSTGHQAAQADNTTYTLPSNQLVTLRRFVWVNGSEAIVDGRGLLHLRSADTTIPEITLVLVLGQATAAWAADGKVTGSSYFIGTTPANFSAANYLSVKQFYQQYIQRFISQLS